MKKTHGFSIFPAKRLDEQISWLSLEAQGLWLRMEMTAHASERYGYLQVRGKPMEDLMIARRAGISIEEYQRIFKEIEDAGCIVRDPRTGVIYIPELVRQDAKRAGNRFRQHNSRRRQAMSMKDLRRSNAQTLSELPEPISLKKLATQEVKRFLKDHGEE